MDYYSLTDLVGMEGLAGWPRSDKHYNQLALTARGMSRCGAKSRPRDAAVIRLSSWSQTRFSKLSSCFRRRTAAGNSMCTRTCIIWRWSSAGSSVHSRSASISSLTWLKDKNSIRVNGIQWKYKNVHVQHHDFVDNISRWSNKTSGLSEKLMCKYAEK